MLKQLKVENYALIQSLDIEFDNGFSTLTGETGAGKSILLGALSLVLGSRADSSSLQNNDNKCIVEAVFDIGKYELEYFFEDNDLDFESHTIIRREISVSGKSRAFINDTPTNLNTLKELSNNLIDIHSQHQTLELNDNSFQLQVIDSVAQNRKLLDEYRAIYKQSRRLTKELETLKQIARESAADSDYNQFQLNQLNSLDLANVNQKALEEELNILSNSETIKQNLSICYSIISNEEVNVVEQLRVVNQSLMAIKDFYPKAEDLIGRLDSIAIELKDISQECEFSAEDIEHNPMYIQQIKERLDGLYEVMHKHKVDSVDELLEVEQRFVKKIEQQVSVDDDIAKVESELLDISIKLNQVGDRLTAKRKDVVAPFSKKIISQLGELGMPHASFVVDMESVLECMPEGKDKVSFMFSANKNIPPQNIVKIASGGEISRLMLGIKSILSESIALPTIIFDEIDTGVSGDIADAMATIMKKMADNMQVISITHLPQIAARGKNHYKIYKQEDELTVQTRIFRLKKEERVDEIARLLSGKDISKEAIENAKTLIG